MVKTYALDGSSCDSYYGCSSKMTECDTGGDYVLATDYAALEAERDLLAARFTEPIVCMCGSTKFKQAWIGENSRLTGEGNIVLSVGLWGHHERVFPDTETKARLDDLHKRKIDLCDWVWVLDVGGYIGDSTRSEIEYATKIGRPIRYLSVEFPNYIQPVCPVEAERDEWKRRCEKMVGIYEDANLSERVANEYIVDPTPEQVREVKYVLARVSRIHRAIAEGRDNG